MFFLQPNQKRLLSGLNPVFFVLAVFVLIMIRTTSDTFLPSLLHQWEVLLPFSIYYGQRRTLPEGLILTLFSSHLFSLCSAAPIGVFTSHYLFIFVVARLLSYVIYAHTWVSIFLLMLSLATLSRIVLTLVSFSFGHGWSLFASGNFVWWSLLFNAGAGCIVYGGLEMLDRVTYKMPRSNIELSDTGL